jgi:hypothetical protein
MTHLVAALHALGLAGEIALGGRWVTLRGERCRVYLVEAEWRDVYYTWCDDPRERAVETYPDPETAIRAGLRRATLHKPWAQSDRPTDNGGVAGGPTPGDAASCETAQACGYEGACG